MTIGTHSRRRVHYDCAKEIRRQRVGRKDRRFDKSCNDAASFMNDAVEKQRYVYNGNNCQVPTVIRGAFVSPVLQRLYRETFLVLLMEYSPIGCDSRSDYSHSHICSPPSAAIILFFFFQTSLLIIPGLFPRAIQQLSGIMRKSAIPIARRKRRECGHFLSLIRGHRRILHA